MADIIKEILKLLPPDTISDSGFEAANIVLYTKDKDYFLDNKGTIRKLVSEFKKRIELRFDPSQCLETEKSKKIIKKAIPEEAGLGNVNFDEKRSIVIIEAEKPGLCICKEGSILNEIKSKTMWTPLIKRSPPIRSIIIE